MFILDCGDVGHPVKSSWKLHLEEIPAKLGAMSTELFLISELKNVIEESERRFIKLISSETLHQDLPNSAQSYLFDPNDIPEYLSTNS